MSFIGNTIADNTYAYKALCIIFSAQLFKSGDSCIVMINSSKSVATLCEYEGIRTLTADVLTFQTLVAC